MSSVESGHIHARRCFILKSGVNPNLAPLPVSSSGTRLHRGYVEEASPEDRPPQTTHVVFVVHGIGQKMDQGRIIKNTGM